MYRTLFSRMCNDVGDFRVKLILSNGILNGVFLLWAIKRVNPTREIIFNFLNKISDVWFLTFEMNFYFLLSGVDHFGKWAARA